MEIITSVESSTLPICRKRKHSESEPEETCFDHKFEGKLSQKENKTGIGELHRFCAQNKLELPCYKIVETTDYANNKQFQVQCITLGYIEAATGKKKKEAKHKASYLLLEKLKHDPKYSDGLLDNFDTLEEGEINDLEEGEINDIIEKNEPTNNNDEDEFLSKERTNYKSYKIYMEGNMSKSNAILTADQSANKSEVENLAEFCFEQNLPAPRYEINEHIGLNASIFSCKCNVLQLMVRTNGPSRISVKVKASKLLLAKMEKHIDILKSDDNGSNKTIKKELDLEEGEILDDDDDDEEIDFNGEINLYKRKKSQMKRNGKQIRLSRNGEITLVTPQNELGMGDLYNFCLRTKIPPPVYEMISKHDLSAMKTVFTFKCSVLKFSKLGKGLNKKQAKHKAARLVLEKLQNWNTVESNRETDDKDLLEEGELTEQDELVKKEYIKHKVDNNFISHEEKNMLQLQSITDRHNVIKTEKPYVNSVILKKLNEVSDEIVKRYAPMILNHLCKEFDCTYNFINVKSLNGNITSVFINTVPPWSTFGKGDTKIEAETNAITRLLQFFKSTTQ